jgi:hypothetical protein
MRCCQNGTKLVQVSADIVVTPQEEGTVPTISQVFEPIIFRAAPESMQATPSSYADQGLAFLNCGHYDLTKVVLAVPECRRLGSP